MRLLRAATLGIFVVLLFAVVLTQIEQHILRRRAEQLLADVRSLEIHRATPGDVQNLNRKWGHLAHYHGDCTEKACTLEISWNDFYFRHTEFLSRLNALHFFLLGGGRPQQINAQVTVDNGVVSGKGFYAVVGVAGNRGQGRWWDYPLMGNAYSLSSFPKNYRPPATHPDYIVGARRLRRSMSRGAFHFLSIRRFRYHKPPHAVRSLLPDEVDSSMSLGRRYYASGVGTV
jgi:hypothetical protein